MGVDLKEGGQVEYTAGRKHLKHRRDQLQEPHSHEIPDQIWLLATHREIFSVNQQHGGLILSNPV